MILALTIAPALGLALPPRAADDPHAPAPPSPAVIYGNDDRLETWQVTDPALRHAARAACAIATADRTELDEFTLGIELHATPWTHVDGVPICLGEPFRGQPAFGHCSGFLVAPDLVATAGHCLVPGAPLVVVFDFQIDDPDLGPPAQVPMHRVYDVVDIVAQSSGVADYAILRLDRPVVGIEPVRIRRDGLVQPDTPLVMAGHPAALPKKITAGAEVRANQPARWDFQANLDAYAGNSGSMVLDADTLVAEGLLARGNPDFRVTGGCVESRRLADAHGTYEQCVKTTAFAWAVPRWTFTADALWSSPLTGPAGGPFSPASLSCRLTNPTTHAIDWALDLAGAPLLLPSGPASGTIAAGASATIDLVVSNAAARLPPGRLAQAVLVRDLTAAGTVRFEPALEIGLETFAWTGARAIPDNGWTDLWLDVSGDHPVAALTVDLDIAHTWIGDLVVELTSPAGTVVRLHERTGGASTGLVRTYDDAATPPAFGRLADFQGQPMAGRWRLFVSDNSGADVGSIRALRLHIFPSAPPRSEGDAAPPVGVFDVNDVIAFADAFTQRGPAGDVAPSFEVWDVNDIIVFVNAFVAGSGQ